MSGMLQFSGLRIPLFALGLCSVACSSASSEPEIDSASSAISLEAPDDVAAPPADAELSDSGLASRVLDAGQGARHPLATDRVRVHYAGWQTDGVLFDSSIRRGRPAEFPLNGVIAGWTEGLMLMVEGERRRLWIPEDLAYRGGEPSGTLVFDVELLEIL